MMARSPKRCRASPSASWLRAEFPMQRNRMRRATSRASVYWRALLADLQYAVRSLRRAPWYSAIVIGVIALGMALSITVFAVVDGVLFKPLPYPNADRLVAIEPGFNNLPAAVSLVTRRA